LNQAMAGTTTGMSKIKQIIRLHLDGYSNRAIAAALEMNKETVNRYVLRATADSMPFEALLSLDDPILEHRLTGGHPAYPDKRFEVFKVLLPYLEEEIKRKHVTLKLLWEEYRETNPGGYSLTQFRFHYNQNAKARKPSTVVRDTYIAGEKLFIDFCGDSIGYVDTETGCMVKVQMFVGCMAVSDYGFAMGVLSQKSEDFIHAIICCLKSLGGVPHIIVPDNLKSAVIKTDPYEPALNHVLEEMANHYGCSVLPARPYRAKDKSPVEGQVKLVYSRVYAELRNETFYSLEELNRAVGAKMLAHNRKRMQRLPYSREEHFLAVEKPALRPLPLTDFEIGSKTELKVGMNGFIFFGRDKHYYSVPHIYTGQKVKIIYTRTLLKVYCNGERIATHTRVFSIGGYTVVEEHLASHAKAYRDRSPDYYIKRGEKAMEELGAVIRKMFETAKVPPETFYRGCDGLIHLEKVTDSGLFKRACETALQYRIYRYAFIKQLVKSRCEGLEESSLQNRPTVPPAHKNVRGKEQFK
jgi:transposase